MRIILIIWERKFYVLTSYLNFSEHYYLVGNKKTIYIHKGTMDYFLEKKSYILYFVECFAIIANWRNLFW